ANELEQVYHQIPSELRQRWRANYERYMAEQPKPEQEPSKSWLAILGEAQLMEAEARLMMGQQMAYELMYAAVLSPVGVAVTGESVALAGHGAGVTYQGLSNTGETLNELYQMFKSGGSNSPPPKTPSPQKPSKPNGKQPEGTGKGIDLSKSNNPSDFLKTAVERQGLDKSPGRFNEKWTEGDYKYEVRAHEAESQYGKTGSICRVSRQKRGEGTEYMDTNGKWHHESTLKETYKDGRPNPLFNENAARDTHIQLP
ncbi:hypothetical protein M5W93_27715, partial [Paenibacillus thiaminolyticus]|nr:hypothetical protein [Paenibacillus thiaminolyticus]